MPHVLDWSTVNSTDNAKADGVTNRKMISSDDEYIHIKITKSADGVSPKLAPTAKHEDLDVQDTDKMPMLDVLDVGREVSNNNTQYSLIRVDTMASKLDQQFPGEWWVPLSDLFLEQRDLEERGREINCARYLHKWTFLSQLLGGSSFHGYIGN